MGRQHVIVGACVVALGTAAGWLRWGWPEAAIMMSGLILAGSDWPDIDHKPSSVTKSWGLVTFVLCLMTRFMSRRVYRWTIERHDPKTRDPHRTLTHTLPGAIIAGAIVDVGLCESAPSAFIVGAMMFGVAMRPIDKKLQWMAAGLGGFMALELWPQMTVDWHWLWWWCAFTVGCVTHIYSDCVTKEGAPLSWPFTRTFVEREVVENEGPLKRRHRPKTPKVYRWRMVGPPQWMRFYTGGQVEVWVVRGIVVLTLLLCYLLVS
jgi:membrane-bound metal-dependent hydrolase YbcI (DUF457 family)